MTTRETWEDIERYIGLPGHKVLGARDSLQYVVVNFEGGEVRWVEVWDVDESTQRQVDALDRAIRLREQWIKKHPCPVAPVRLHDLDPVGSTFPYVKGVNGQQVIWEQDAKDSAERRFRCVWKQAGMLTGVDPSFPDEIWWLPLPNSARGELVGGRRWHAKPIESRLEKHL